MIPVLLAIALAMQFGQRAPLTPAETLLASVVLRAISEAPGDEVAGTADAIAGSGAKTRLASITSIRTAGAVAIK